MKHNHSLSTFERLDFFPKWNTNFENIDTFLGSTKLMEKLGTIKLNESCHATKSKKTII